MSIDRGYLALSVSLLLAFAAACGAAPASPATPASPAPLASASSNPEADAAAPTSETASAGGETWSDSWPKDKQIAFMKKSVAPRLGKVFKAHDAAQYADFSCKTCHGPAYKNPHEFLPKLALKDGKLTAFADKDKAAISKFMAESVVPEMASAMGEPPYDPKTQKGFGCGGCHSIDKI